MAGLLGNELVPTSVTQDDKIWFVGDNKLASVNLFNRSSTKSILVKVLGSRNSGLLLDDCHDQIVHLGPKEHKVVNLSRPQILQENTTVKFQFVQHFGGSSRPLAGQFYDEGIPFSSGQFIVGTKDQLQPLPVAGRSTEDTTK